MSDRPVIGAVVIGRNEGARLVQCLASIPDRVTQVVYVDSGSTDGSVAAAQAAGADVVELDMTRPFTAARARNEGYRALNGVEYVQFIDGDCELRPGWVQSASDWLDIHPETAVVCGRRRERFPEASVYNRLCDREWDTPVGDALACGGDALMRSTAFDGVGGFDASLIAGEEPDLCLRLRGKGWTIHRLDAEMTWHDAALTRFGQWWKRTRRAGHAFAEGAARHGRPPERHWVVETRRALLWGIVIPAIILILGLFASPLWLLLVLLYPLQVARLALQSGGTRGDWEWATFVTLGKFAEAQGVLGYWLGRVSGRQRGLIEYK